LESFFDGRGITGIAEINNDVDVQGFEGGASSTVPIHHDTKAEVTFLCFVLMHLVVLYKL